MSLRAMLGTAPKDLAPAVALEASRLVLLGTPSGLMAWYFSMGICQLIDLTIRPEHSWN
jgi:hypothetical protein